MNSLEKLDAEILGYLHGQRRIPVSELRMDPIQQRIKVMGRLDFVSNEPILLLISSNGGNYEATMQFCDFIASLNSPVDAVVCGECCSMAVDLLQMCRKRMLLPASRLLVHYIRHNREWIGDDLVKLEADIALFRQDMIRLREQRFILYEKRTGLSRERLEELFRYGEIHRASLSADQALELNIADEIITDFKLFPDKKYEG